MKRRAFMRLAFLGWIGAMIDPESSAAVIGAPHRVTSILLDDLQVQTEDLGRLLWTRTPASIWPAVLGQLGYLRGLVGSSLAPARERRVMCLASETATVAGITAHRLGRYDAASYFALATSLAGAANDGPLQAHALIAMRDLHSGVTAEARQADPVKAVALLEEAETVSGSSLAPAQRARLLANRAEDYATLGQSAACHRDLDSALQALSQVTGPTTGYHASWNETRLAAFRGSCLVLLGEAGAAVPVIERVLTEIYVSLVAPYTASLSDLAGAYAQLGEVEQSCSLLDEALTIAAENGIRKQVDRAIRTRTGFLAGVAATAPSVARLDGRIHQLQADWQA